MTLLEQIQNEAVDGTSDLATALRKCLILAARLKNQEFTEWVNHELNGYPEDAIGQIPTKVRKVPQKGPSNAKPFALRFKLASASSPTGGSSC
jgi:hypothetical protein